MTAWVSHKRSRIAAAPPAVIPAAAGQVFPGLAGSPAPWTIPVGYQNAPGYTSLTTWSGATMTAGQTYSHIYFPVGLQNYIQVSNLTFIGCLFESNATADANVSGQWSNTCNNITFSYCTFRPLASVVAAPPCASGQGYEYGIDQRGIIGLTVDHCEFWGFLAAIQVNGSSAAFPDVFTYNCLHDPTNSAIEIDGILSSNGSTGFQYVTISNNTIMGNTASYMTNGIALQYSGTGYSNVTAQGNYISGWSYSVSLGGGGGGDGSQSSYITFTDNVFGADQKPTNAQCNSVNVGTGTGSSWLRNTYYVPGAGSNPASPWYGASASWMSGGNNGLFWWPGDGEPPDGSTIIGHATDY